ncbi:hypothetical protein KPK_A0167 (plasmid) [Klebsiella variicola]|uniref:Uncharacterized protein n=1 Tax=Klebsiella variicola (strain 342) TaxID=507522 RepID=B5RK88_KLEV3|nr:hypothetical protein KPK_A0167 [Klebsiella variicola]
MVPASGLLPANQPASRSVGSGAGEWSQRGACEGRLQPGIRISG